MASQQVINAELGTASAGGSPQSQVEPQVVTNSVYQPSDRSQNYQKEELQALGFISSGSTSVAAGRKPTRIFSFSISFPSFFSSLPPFNVGMQNSFGMNIASATIALVGFVFLSINLAVNSLSFKSCQSSPSPDLCIYTGASSHRCFKKLCFIGLVSLMLILTLLELCITISISAMWCKANCCHSREERIFIKVNLRAKKFNPKSP
ncbi:PREDICTED: membrane-spanning 4-domains subfamily A member 3 [Hipposideros armiger]|uniref:Membrane-spanning 4-domains subfamily A member 3 n=1 Tax=Hipposideros armiger TaxID=186990 RepID=A0A8B7SDS7_HIPAR|nr:PREDICTED: membrane-spanning 4-domains subfamily A member 3 [Hipposideros armiger]